MASSLAKRLGEERVCYDNWYQAELARLNLDLYLQLIYHEQSDLIVVFISSDYETKEWCGLEWRAIRDLIKKKRDLDIMIIKMDDVEIGGLFSMYGFGTFVLG